MKIYGLMSIGAAAAFARRRPGCGPADEQDRPAPPAAVSCFASFYDYMRASAQDCPLTYMGVTVYGQIDVGAG